MYYFSRARRFREKYGISLYKTSAIDPARAAQASEEIAVNFQTMLQNAITALHAQDPLLFPWKSLAEIPDSYLFNMDEVGENGEHKREKKLCAALLGSQDWMRVLDTFKGPPPDAIKRMFEVANGDNGDGLGHRTVCLTTCGNGLFQDGNGPYTPGACAPLLCHATPPTKAGASPKKGATPPSGAPTSRMTENIHTRGVPQHGIKVQTNI